MSGPQTKPGPRRGERVLACPHKTGLTHWISFEEPDTFTRDDGFQFEARWVGLCTSCLKRAGSAESKAHRDYVVKKDIVIEIQPPPPGARYNR